MAIVSQSGGLGANVFAPLMTDREIGFSHFMSCGNQVGATIEDYVAYLVDDPEVTVIAAVIEQLKNPRKLERVARPRMRGANPSCCFRPAGPRPAASWCSPIPGRSPAMRKSSRPSCAVAASCRSSATTNSSRPRAVRDRAAGSGGGRDLVVISGSGGGAGSRPTRSTTPARRWPLDPRTRERIDAGMPEFGSVTNPIDGTGAIYDDPALLPKSSTRS